jgi:hypothetical protein
MPITYVCDDARRRYRITLTEPVTARDVIASLDRQVADGAWAYGAIVDTRSPFVPPSQSDMKGFVSRIRELVAQHGPRGPIAIVAKESTQIATAQMYLFFGGKTPSIEVFWHLDDAQQWLDEQMAGGAPSP